MPGNKPSSVRSGRQPIPEIRVQPAENPTGDFQESVGPESGSSGAHRGAVQAHRPGLRGLGIKKGIYEGFKKDFNRDLNGI